METMSFKNKPSKIKCQIFGVGFNVYFGADIYYEKVYFGKRTSWFILIFLNSKISRTIPFIRFITESKMGEP